MYGKHFEKMYRSSLVGSGPVVFAVWGYVISNARAGTVDLNPKILAAILGTTEKEVRKAIDFLCAPDPESTNKAEEGRRLKREGQFQYFVVTWESYRAIRTEADLKEYNRLRKAEQRARKKRQVPGPRGFPGAGLVGDGANSEEVADMVNRERLEQ